jgi:hypothetical protein
MTDQQVLAAEKAIMEYAASTEDGADKTNEGLKKALKAVKGWTPQMEKLWMASYANADAKLKELDGVNAQLDAATKYNDALRRITSATDGINAQLDILLATDDEWQDNMNRVKDTGEDILRSVEAVTTNANKEISALRKRAEIAKKGGDASEALGEVQRREIKAAGERYKAALGEVPRLKKMQDNAAKRLEEARKQLAGIRAEKPTTPEGKKKLETAESRMRELENVVGDVGRQIGQAEEDVAQAMSEFASPVEVMDDSMRKADGDADMLSSRLKRDLGEAMADAALYAQDLGKYAEESFKMGAEAAEEEAAVKRRYLEQALKTVEKNEEEKAKALEAGGDFKAAARVREEAKVTAERLKQKESAKIETELKRGVVDSAKRSLELKQGELDVAAGTLDSAMDIAEAFDGSAGVVGPLLEKQMGVEKARLKEMKKTAAESRRVSGDSLETRRLELEVVKQEAKIRKGEYDNAKKVIELRRQEVDTVQSVLEAEMDYLQEVGGSFGRMADLQGQILGMERQRVDLAKDALDAAIKENVSGQELLEKEAAYEIAKFNYQKKAMGAQKSMLDKFLGAAFGGLSNVGARKGMDNDRALLGIAGSRVVTPSGMFMGTGGGPTGTIEERTAKMQFAGAGGGVGLSGKGPKKAKIEEEMAKHSKTTAEATGEMNKNSGTRGSLYTHDDGAQSILSSMLSVLKDIKSALTGGVKETTEAAKETTKAVETTVAVSEKQEAGKAADASAETLDSQLKLAKRNWKLAKDEYALAKKENRLSKKEESAVRDSANKLTALEAQVRKAENENPYAGAAGGIEDYDRVMAGRVMPEIEQFAKEAAKSAKSAGKAEKSRGKVANKAAAKFGAEAGSTATSGMGGGKFAGTPMNRFGGAKYDPFAKTLGGGGKARAIGGAIGKTLGGAGKSKSMAKEMGKAMVAGSKAKVIGGAMGKAMLGPAKKTEADDAWAKSWEQVKQESMSLETPVGLAAKGRSEDDPTAWIADSWAKLPDQVKQGMMPVGLAGGESGAASPVTPVGGVGAMAASTDNVFTVKGEAQVKVQFDNKMFKDAVVQIMMNEMRNSAFQNQMGNIGFATTNKGSSG